MSSMKIMNPRVKWFIEEMKKKLRLNTHKTEPRDLSYQELFDMLDGEVYELKVALGSGILGAIIKESADVGNISMMIADKAHQEQKEKDK